MNAADKRLAVMVEDCPYSYKDFEVAFPKAFTGPEMAPTLYLMKIN